MCRHFNKDLPQLLRFNLSSLFACRYSIIKEQRPPITYGYNPPARSTCNLSKPIRSHVPHCVHVIQLTALGCSPLACLHYSTTIGKYKFSETGIKMNFHAKNPAKNALFRWWGCKKLQDYAVNPSFI